jgi:tetratricopeptide (TPR) repeat protein
MAEKLKSVAALTCCASLTVAVLTLSCFGQTTRNVTYPDEGLRSESAQSLFEKGLTAAKKGDFSGATRSFARAHKADPANLNIVFNLGLAESKMPGWELPGLESFAVFLAANPQAKNAGEVRRQTNVLVGRTEATINESLSGAREIIGQFRRDTDRKNALRSLSQEAVDLLNDNRRPELGLIVSALRQLVADDSASPASPQRIAPWLTRIQFQNSILADSKAYLQSLSHDGNAETMLAGILRLVAALEDELRSTAVTMASERGFAYYEANQSDKALDNFNLALSIYPFDTGMTEVFSTRGKLYAQRGDYARALANYDEAVRQNPHSKNIFDRGVGRFLNADYESAGRDFDRAFELEASPYDAIWSFLAWSRAGHAAEAKNKLPSKLSPEMLSALGDDAGDSWPDLVVSLFRGEGSPVSLMPGPSADPSQICEAFFYLGEYALLHARRDDAAFWFKRELAAGPSCGRSIEYLAATAELVRLNSR